MIERPPRPSKKPEKPFEELTVEELELRIEKVTKEMEDLIRRKGRSKDPFVKRNLNQEYSSMLNEKAKYIVRRDELLSKR